MLSQDLCYRAMQSKDTRFDGMVYVAVTTTGIYCRPSCPAMAPKAQNVRFFPTAAAAQESGFRACKRCRPDAVPGSPEWNVRNDVAGRAMRMISDGLVDRAGVEGLAGRLGYSSRQVRRSLIAELGASPLALARAQRAQTARILLETTALPTTDVAFAAGFSSVRQFNDTIRAVYSLTPTALRQQAARQPAAAEAGAIRLRLPYRPPLGFQDLLAFLRERAVPGVEEVTGGAYRRVLRLPHGLAVATVQAGSGKGSPHLACTLRLADLRDLPTAAARLRNLFDLDADPLAVAAALAEDSVVGPLVRAAPGRRVPGHVDPDELAVRAVLGQQVSVAAARTHAARLAQRLGPRLPAPSGSLTHAFPSAAAIADMNPADFAMPRSRAQALLALTRALAEGTVRLEPGTDREEAGRRLLELPGIGPWTVAYVRLRALGDPDVFLPTDLGVRHALARLGAPGDPGSAERLAERWRPWRAYALMHLWAALGDTPPTVATKE